MDNRGGAAAEGQAMNAWIRETPMRQMADQLGIPELPMRQAGFDFYTHAVHHLKQMGFAGQELYHAAHEVIQTLFFNIGKRARSVEGPIYKYVKWYEDQIGDGVKPQPFDEFFKYAFRQKANTQLKKLLSRKKKRGLSIDYGSQGQDEGGVSEDFLGVSEEPSAEEAYAEKEESEKRAEVFKQIPTMLSEHRLGDKYVSVWNLMRKNYKLAEIAEELNVRGILAPGGGEWGTGSVHKVRNQVYGMVKRFLEQQGIDWESIIASRSRNGFRFGLVPEG
jgi:hypothetical protein